ncbi:MAG: tRNA (adenosine(37)-N6)-dimethylallyltransferase MiaA [Phycisphaera sp.]|nr:tRNA (adenosine(37)-N6)-dimethylallyltransferase MiaA [Phycisphaera sp.]
MSRVIVVVGPTAGGKSELAVELAERLGGDHPRTVLGADSMQVYRHMDAGTAKPPPEIRTRAPHELIDIVEPTERFTVADWLQRAEAVIGREPVVVVGGTNLYIKALLEGLFDGPGIDEALRRELAAMSNQALHERLRQVDPVAGGRIHVNDTKRMVRAIEVYEMTGQPISAQQGQWHEAGLPGEPSGGGYRHGAVLVGLDWPTEAINRRINARVKAMFQPADGSEPLPDEVARLDRSELLGPQAREALGYKQVLAALRGECSMDDALEQTKIQTRRFAKQQRTWLKRYRNVLWIDPREGEPATWAGLALEAIR